MKACLESLQFYLKWSKEVQGQKMALKQEKPPNYWEYYILLEVQSRLKVDEMVSVIKNDW